MPSIRTPRVPAPFATTILLASLAITGAPAPAQVGPEESARLLRPAEGLEATLWAAEPMVVNPTNMDIDSRGRVWITEGLNYRLTRSGNARFSRIEDADKIKILTDTDGDGRADQVKVFADRIYPVPMGLAVEEHWSPDGKYLGCRVYVGNSPDLLVFEDTDGDDKADRRFPLLTGFGGVDSDHGVHGMVLGLDGWLYFTHGDGCCSVQQDKTEKPQNFDVVDASGRRVRSDQLANTLRVRRDGTQFEVIADRQRNNYETAPNSFGNLFTSDNDDDGNRGSRVIWVMDGGQYGYRTPGSSRHWAEEVPGSVPKLVGTGNGSPCGILCYEGDLLPRRYHGALLEAEAGTRQINVFPLTRRGAAFRTEYQVLLGSEDPWFRPVDMCVAPDGSVLVADWYDAGVGGHAFSDQNTGRIFRVAPKGHRPTTPRPDFGSIEGLIEALKSPNVATADAACRGLIARGAEAIPALKELGKEPRAHIQARMMWAAAQIPGSDFVAATARAMADRTSLFHRLDPRIRELAVRILGRDLAENGDVTNPEGRPAQSPRALEYLDALKALAAADPDAGVRRELILALRRVPTEQAGEALRALAAGWDGQDRWYLEALGLALRHRESDFLASLFDGDSLYGDLDLERSGKATGLALPPYFPTDRNEAFLSVHDADRPSNALSKTLGLMWEVHTAEILPLLERILPALESAELQQAADDVLAQVSDPKGAAVLARLALTSPEPARRRQALASLARRLQGTWAAARRDETVVKAVTAGLDEPAVLAEAVDAAAATEDARFAGRLSAIVAAESTPIETRVLAVEALARLNAPESGPTIEGLIRKAIDRRGSDPLSEAAVRSLTRVVDSPDRRLNDLILDSEVPLGLRREAMRTLLRRAGGGHQIIELAREGKLPEELRTEAAVELNRSTDRGLRDRAARVLPLPKAAGGKPLPPFGELIRRDGDPERGRAVFFEPRSVASTGTSLACGSCHRVQGRGQWVGPDLSTIGTKYGRDELLRSILSPSAAIGYSFRSLNLATSDGRVLSGLVVEETPERLVLKTASGERIPVRAAEIEERRDSEVSLMPEGLAETMGEQDLVDLLAFLTTLKQPVSIVGQMQAAGPLLEKGGTPALDPTQPVDPASPLTDAAGNAHAWRRLDANAEGLIETASSSEPGAVTYLQAPIVSEVEQPARLVVESSAPVQAWLAGQPVELPEPKADQLVEASVTLPAGRSTLVLRAPAGARLVATVVADRAVEFSAGPR